MSNTRKVFITVKTYPTLSKKYDELVCTAGILDNGKESKMMIEDWEIGMLYWNCLKQVEGNESEALILVRKKYIDEFSTKDLHLFLGTTRQFHSWAKNPFVIIGVFYPPIDRRLSLF